MTDLEALSAAEFEQFRALILRVSGISLKDSKRELVAGRLARRLRHHGLSSYGEYLELIARGGAAAELTELVNCITTNKTSFFREPHHFDRLRHVLVPAWVERARRGGSRRVRIWSAGCSTGEEPYSIAMVLHDALPATAGWDVRIIATDIDTQVLEHAAAARYPLHQLDDLPPEARACCMRGATDFAIRDEVRARVELRQLNLIAPAWPLTGLFDAIFCRNVVIYFDLDTQRRLFDRFADALNSDGRLFVGHAENLMGITERFSLDGQTVYCPVGARRPASLVSTIAPARTTTIGPGRAASTLPPDRATTVPLAYARTVPPYAESAPQARTRTLPLGDATTVSPVRTTTGTTMSPVRTTTGTTMSPVRTTTAPPAWAAGATSMRRGRRVAQPAGAVPAGPASAPGSVAHVAVGEVWASVDPVHYCTVLGSCVSACLHDPVARIGGLNHFALPAPEAGAPDTARYGSVAMPQLIAQLVALGADPRRLVAKVFGASLVLPEMAEVAERNAQHVRAFLAAAAIPIVVERLGGPRPIELHFLSDRGTALFRDVAAEDSAR